MVDGTKYYILRNTKETIDSNSDRRIEMREFGKEYDGTGFSDLVLIAPYFKKFTEVSREVELPTEQYSVIKDVTLDSGRHYDFATLVGVLWYCVSVDRTAHVSVLPDEIMEWEDVN